MKKFIFLFIFSFFLFFDLFTLISPAQSKSIRQGLYSFSDLNLATNSTHTIQNNSDKDYAFMMVFDSNQIAQQLLQLKPNSETYILTNMQPGYQLLVVTNDEVAIN